MVAEYNWSGWDERLGSIRSISKIGLAGTNGWAAYGALVKLVWLGRTARQHMAQGT